jgi:hypothetical protein
MKKIFLFILGLLLINTLDAQVCVVDYSQTSVGIYPDTLPSTIAGDFYDEDVTFVLPTDTMGFDFTNFQIVSANVPIGMSWECSNNQNGCNYDPQADPFGCARIYGTPLLPGFYEIEIQVIADLTISSGNLTSFFVYLEVLPSQQSNAGFTMNPPSGCDEVTVEFINNNPSGNYAPIPNLTQGFLYLWDFDNGTQSVLENPPPQTYSVVGEYVVEYNCIIDTLGFFLDGITVNTVGCSDAIGFGNPDLFVLIYDADWNVVYSSQSALNDNDLPVSWSPNVPLINPPYRIQVWDDDSDNWIGSSNDNCVDGDENPSAGSGALGIDVVFPAIDDYGQTTQSGNNAGLNLTYSINKPIIELNAEDTVTVLQGVAAPIVTYNPTTNMFSTPDLGYDYQWFVNGSPIPGETGVEYEPSGAGSFTVVAIDGPCFAESNALEFTANMLKHFKDDLKVFPNPASDIVTIEVGERQVESISIFDVTGRLVYSKTENISEIETIDVTNFSKGYFTIVLKEANHVIKSKLIVK